MNPSFNLSVKDARAGMAEMVDRPVAFERPLLIFAGYLDPGFATWMLESRFCQVTGDDCIIKQAFAFCRNFEACRDTAIAAIEDRFPRDDPTETVEVDVIGFSMGGLIARYAAMPIEGKKRLRIRRLFTIGTPHRGAIRAAWPGFHRLHRDMRTGSAFLTRLDEGWASADYTLYAYVRLGDKMVGEKNAAPPGQLSWWVPPIRWTRSHTDACRDPRIVVDIARRLRNETPFATEPVAPFPEL